MNRVLFPALLLTLAGCPKDKDAPADDTANPTTGTTTGTTTGVTTGTTTGVTTGTTTGGTSPCFGPGTDLVPVGQGSCDTPYLVNLSQETPGAVRAVVLPSSLP